MTEITGLTPTRTKRKGEPVTKKATLKCKHDIWGIHSDAIETFDAVTVAKDVLSKLEGKHATINKACKDFHLEPILNFTIYRAEDGGTPSIFLDKEILAIIHAIDAEIDVDFLY